MTMMLNAPIQEDLYQWRLFDRAGEFILAERAGPCWNERGEHPGKHAFACVGDLDRIGRLVLEPRGIFPGNPPTYTVDVPADCRLVFTRRRSFDKDLSTGEYLNPRTTLIFGHEPNSPDTAAVEAGRVVRCINYRGELLEGVTL